MFDYDVEAGEIYIYDDIGPAWMGMIDATSVIGALSKMPGRVTVRLNSAGGSVDEGIAIYNALKRHKGGVETVVDSLAASMASYLMQAGDVRTVAENAMVMVHNPWSIAIGNAAAFRKEADILDKYEERMLPEYASRTGRLEDDIRSMLDEETWMVGSEAVDLGFADRVEGEAIEPVEVAEGRFQKTPKDVLSKRVAGSRTEYFPRRQRAKAIKNTIG